MKGRVRVLNQKYREICFGNYKVGDSAICLSERITGALWWKKREYGYSVLALCRDDDADGPGTEFYYWEVLDFFLDREDAVDFLNDYLNIGGTMETSSTWYVFAGQGYSTGKGMQSFRGEYDTIDEAKECLSGCEWDWYQIVKAKTMVVWEHGWIYREHERVDNLLVPEKNEEFKNGMGHNRGILE